MESTPDSDEEWLRELIEYNSSAAWMQNLERSQTTKQTILFEGPTFPSVAGCGVA